MSEISVGTTLTTALVATGDTTGNLVVKTGSSAATALTVSATGNLSLATGNLTFSSTGQRITGDMSNATISSRLLIQTSVVDTNTTVGVIPNGTGNVSTISLESNATATNNSIGQISIVGGTDYRINSGIRGTGTYLPMTFYTGGSERMRLDTSGRVGIATTNPNVNLTVSATSGESFRLINSTGAERLHFYTRNSAGTSRIDSQNSDFQLFTADSGTALIFGTVNAERMRITSGGEVYIAGTTDQGAYNLQCNGTGVWGAGAYVNGSDERLKDNIQSLDSGLDVVKAIRPVTFQYKPEYSKDQSVQPGFIAQELQTAMAGKAYLEGVVQEGPNHLNVAYQNIIPILVKAIQELEAKVAALEAK